MSATLPSRLPTCFPQFDLNFTASGNKLAPRPVARTMPANASGANRISPSFRGIIAGRFRGIRCKFGQIEQKCRAGAMAPNRPYWYENLSGRTASENSHDMTSTPHPATGRPPFQPTRRFQPWAFTRRNKWLLLGGLLIIVVLFVLIRHGTQTATAPGGQFGAGAPMAINAAKVEKGDVQVVLNALGTVTPLQNVTVRTQINGQLQQIAFTEGQMV